MGFGSVVKVVKKVARKTKQVVRETRDAVGNAVKGTILSASDAVVGTVKGVAKMVGGDPAGGYALMIRSGIKFAHPFVSVPATIVAALYSAILSKGRHLTTTEKTMLRVIFQDSVDYNAVTVKADVRGINGRAFTIDNMIHLAKDNTIGTLIHEMVHVWQFQNGGTDYVAASIYHQARMFEEIYVGEPYDWRSQVDAGKTWAFLGAEQQAALVEAAYGEGHFSGNLSWSHAAYMEQCLAKIRGGHGAP
jgi:hypothetical protein